MLFLDHQMPPNASQWMRSVFFYLTIMDCYGHVDYCLIMHLLSQITKTDSILGFLFLFFFCKKQNEIYHIFSLCCWFWLVNHQNLFFKGPLSRFAMMWRRQFCIFDQGPGLGGPLQSSRLVRQTIHSCPHLVPLKVLSFTENTDNIWILSATQGPCGKD